MKKIFKDRMNKWITSGLFKEVAQRPLYVIYTLEETRKLFLESNDPTGYLYSTEHLGGYPHWLALKNSPALEHHILAWEDELEIKIRSKALQNICTASTKEKGFSASRYLVEAGWKDKTTGRPSKKAIKEESIKRSKIYEEFNLKSVK